MADQRTLTQRALTLGSKAHTHGVTARRYSELCGGGDDPRGELWDAIAYVSEMMEELVGLVWEHAHEGHASDG